MNATITANTATYANHMGWSDINPYEIVRVISEKTIEIKSMNAERDTSVAMDFVIGGFSAHCTNQHAQKWHITSDQLANTIRIRLGKNGWKDRGGSRYVLSTEPQKFYDYNF